MVGTRPASPTPPTMIGNKNSQLGVFVDCSGFDEDDDLGGFGTDMPSVIEEDQVFSGSGVVMRNGKVRRKLRWKPPGFKKKKRNVSSNASVVSALTNRSSATNRSSSTTKSFLSQFSRKSHQSFHTFNSTETPIATNKANKPIAPHTISRPNYPDTFDIKQTTIDSEGRQGHRRTGSAKVLETLNEVAVFERSSTLPPRLDSMPLSPHSPMPESPIQYFDPYGEDESSVNSDPFDALDAVDIPLAAPRVKKKPKKSKRPPLFKRKRKKGKNHPTSPAETSQSSTNNSASSTSLTNYTAPTMTSSGSAFSATVSLEREDSILPTLEIDDYEEDRRVALCIRTRSRIQEHHSKDYVEIDAASVGAHSAAVSDQSIPSAAYTSTTNSARNRPGKPQLAPNSPRPLSPTSNSRPASPVSQNNPQTPSQHPTRKFYHRPVDSMTSPTIDSNQVETASTDEQGPVRRTPTSASVPVDIDNGAFLEAEYNLRAIHDMAAEHLGHGEYEEATEVFEEILRGQQERYGKDHYRVGTALHNLGIVHMKSCRFEDAIDCFGEAVAVRKEALVPDHPGVSVSLAQLGVVHLESEHFEDALVAFREALHIRRTYLGTRHPKCSKILNNIGCALFSLDEFEGSRLAFEEALDIQRGSLNMISSSENIEDSSGAHSNGILLSMASTLCNIGSIKLRCGQFNEAEVVLEEALLIQQSVHGDEHPLVVSTMENIAFIEKSKEGTFPSPIDFLQKWSNNYQDPDNKNGALMCTPGPRIEEVLNLEVFSSLSSHSWYRQMKDAMTETGCGGGLRADDQSSALGRTSTDASDQDGGSGLFSF